MTGCAVIGEYSTPNSADSALVRSNIQIMIHIIRGRVNHTAHLKGFVGEMNIMGPKTTESYIEPFRKRYPLSFSL